MRLLPNNKELNRKFHLMSENKQLEFLLNGYSQVFPESTMQKIRNLGRTFRKLRVKPEELAKRKNHPLIRKINGYADKLNFLMSRFNMLNDPKYEKHIKNLCLLRWEYLFMKSDTDQTQDVDLVVDFFEKRGKPEYIIPVLHRMGEKAVNWDHLAQIIIKHPELEKYLGEEEKKVYELRTLLHDLVSDRDYSKEQAAEFLLKKGYDLIELDFNKWYAFEDDFSINLGDTKYEPDEKNDEWLKQFVENERKGDSADHKKDSKDNKSLDDVIDDETTEESVDDDNYNEDDEDESTGNDHEENTKELTKREQFVKYLEECKPFTTEYLEGYHNQLEEIINENKLENIEHYKSLRPLFSDYSEVIINSKNKVQDKMWEELWSGDVPRLIYQLKGANPDGETRIGLNYVLWALTHDEHSKHINRNFGEFALAMVIAGDILVGDLHSAIENLKDPDVQIFVNNDKIKAAVNYAFGQWQHPGESDDEDNDEDYEPPKRYCFYIVEEFRDYLKDHDAAQPYIKLLEAEKPEDINGFQLEILKSLSSLEEVEKYYTKLGMQDKIKSRFVEILEKTYERAVKYTFMMASTGRITKIITDETFKKYVDDETIREKLTTLVNDTLVKKSEYDSDKEDRGTKKIVAKFYQNPILKPYLGEIDLGSVADKMIDDLISEDLINKPFSLRHQGELCFMGNSETIEVYKLANGCRELVTPEKMQDLVAWFLAIGCELKVGGGYEYSILFDFVSSMDDNNYKRPDYLSASNKDGKKDRLTVVNNVYLREKELGGFDEKKASTAVTNVIYKGTYVQPGRFYPHIDSVLLLLNSPVAELLPKEGLGFDTIKEYHILNDFMKG